MDPVEEFQRRLLAEWLPDYCQARDYSVEGFDPNAKSVSSEDAGDFMRALDEGVVSVEPGGKFRMPRSKTFEVLFWEGSREAEPRPISLWLEPLITIAGAARLHFDHGWPLDCIGMQSEQWQFDLVAFHPGDLEHEHIAGEAKSDSKQVDKLIKEIVDCGARGPHDCPKARQNSHNKWRGLVRSRAPVFWAFAPGGDSREFEVWFRADGTMTFLDADNSVLHCP